MRTEILIIEDDKSTSELLGAALEEAGYSSKTARSIAEAKDVLNGYHPDLIILDRGLPDGDGLRLCLDLRKDPGFAPVPILMLTGISGVLDKALGLRFGADDYLVKPFDMEEFLARVDALLRRCRITRGYLSEMEYGGISVNLRTRQAAVNGIRVELSNAEYELLRVFLERPEEALSRESLIKKAWGRSPGAICAKTVDVTVMNLRKKLGKKGKLIISVRSHGYRITESSH